MKKHLVQPFKMRLLAQRSRVLAQLISLRGGNVGRAEASAQHFRRHEDSTAQEATARDLELALDANESAGLAAIDAALKRIEDGVYGMCSDCGIDIPAKRLEAAPEASRCITCQTASEHALS